MRVVFAAPELRSMREELLAHRDVEACAIAFARATHDRLVVRDIIYPDATDYARRTRVAAELKPEYLFEQSVRAKRDGLSLVFVHSHPFDDGQPEFSSVDDAGEERLASFLANLLGERPHAAIVVSPGGLSARALGSDVPAVVIEVGEVLDFAFAPDLRSPADQFDRQVRAFGQAGQARVGALRVAIVGAGGTGSVTAQQLAHFGVTDFTLVDFDAVEETNLNRLVGAGPNDVGTLKVEVARRTILSAQPGASVTTIVGDVTDDRIAERLKGCDVIFACTDSHASRAVLNQIAYQHLIPAIDMGVSLSVRGGVLTHITGRVQLLSPGLPCLTCMELLDSEQIRRELLTPEERKADPYIIGASEPQPSVISINSTMASLAVTMLIGLVTGAPVAARIQFYDGINGTVRPMSARRESECYTCSASGALARADGWALPTRRAQP